jgi:hypothetical protein
VNRKDSQFSCTWTTGCRMYHVVALCDSQNGVRNRDGVVSCKIETKFLNTTYMNVRLQSMGPPTLNQNFILTASPPPPPQANTNISIKAVKSQPSFSFSTHNKVHILILSVFNSQRFTLYPKYLCREEEQSLRGTFQSQNYSFPATLLPFFIVLPL